MKHCETPHEFHERRQGVQQCLPCPVCLCYVGLRNQKVAGFEPRSQGHSLKSIAPPEESVCGIFGIHSLFHIIQLDQAWTALLSCPSMRSTLAPELPLGPSKHRRQCILCHFCKSSFRVSTTRNWRHILDPC